MYADDAFGLVTRNVQFIRSNLTKRRRNYPTFIQVSTTLKYFRIRDLLRKMPNVAVRWLRKWRKCLLRGAACFVVIVHHQMAYDRHNGVSGVCEMAGCESMSLSCMQVMPTCHSKLTNCKVSCPPCGLNLWLLNLTCIIIAQAEYMISILIIKWVPVQGEIPCSYSFFESMV